MGVDVTFLPIEHESEDLCYSHTLLPLWRRRELWPLLDDLLPKNLDRAISCYVGRDDDGELCYGELLEDCYGRPLTYLTVAQLLTVDRSLVNDGNKAIWAYLGELPPETKIVIYWH